MSVCDAWRTTQEPSRWSVFFAGEKWSIVVTWRSPTTMSASPATIGAHQRRDVAPVVLVVGVGVDDHVGAELEAGVEARLEAVREALVVRQPDDVVDAVLARDVDRAVGRPVVDDEPLDDVEPVHLAGQVVQRDGERFLLVQAGDLDDQLHGPGRVQSTIGAVISRLRAEGPALAVLGLMLLAGLVLRVLHNDHGLPYIYYVDEGSHFTKRAVEVFGDPNPGYFQNPSAYTYLLHADLPRRGAPARRRRAR